ncbi:MAG TPA: LLM class flavin-dependent oxidoreductase [Limnochorda sp.]
MERSLVLTGGTVREAVALARAAELAGFAGVWIVQREIRDTWSRLAAIGSATSRLRLGAWLSADRHPVLLVPRCLDVDDLSGGRVALALYGGRAGGPRIREAVELLRALLSAPWGSPFRFRGRFYEVQFDHYPFRFRQPGQRSIPLWLVGAEPTLARLAGEVAEGLVVPPLESHPYLADVIRPALLEGAVRSGRSRLAKLAGCLAVAGVGDEASTQSNVNGTTLQHGPNRLASIRSQRQLEQYVIARLESLGGRDLRPDGSVRHSTAEEQAGRLRELADVLDEVVLCPPTFGLR